MFDPKEVDLDAEPGYYVDLKEEVEEECGNFGEVLDCFLEICK